jgi:hypothetical protein
MTIKEIAEIANVSVSTIKNWIALSKIDKPSAEIAKATNEPFRFNLDEITAIIRAGGRETLANLLADNAARYNPGKPAGLPDSGAVLELIGIIRSQAAVIEHLTKETRAPQGPNTGSAPAMLAGRSDDAEAWINTTRLAALYGKSLATCLSHARAMGWTMRLSRLETGSLTYEFLLASLPEKIKNAWAGYKERGK